jgi:hypothetical protein
MNTQRLVREVVDYGDAQEIFVTGYVSVSRVSNGVIRETYYREVELPDGTVEKRVALRLLWDADQWFAARQVNALNERYLGWMPPPQDAARH